MMTFRRSVSPIIVPIIVAIVASRAQAQPATVQAQSLFDEGRKLLDAGKIAEACTAFESSQKLDPAVTTLLNLAECRERNHQLATAWGAFVDAERMARSKSDDKLAKVATTHAAKLEPRLSHLTIAVASERRIAGLEVARGNDKIDVASWNHDLPIDGGTYTITAKAPGHEPWLTTIAIKEEGEARTLDIPELTAKVQVGPVTNEPVDKPRVGEHPPSDTPAPSNPLVLPITVAGGAVVLGVGAILFELSGNNIYDQAKASTDQSQRDSLETSANHRRYVAEGLGVAALGAAGAAVFLYLRGEHHADATAVAPTALAHGAGLAVIGHW